MATGDYVTAIGLLISAGADHYRLARWDESGLAGRHSV
jgi:hypothetical protein